MPVCTLSFANTGSTKKAFTISLPDPFASTWQAWTPRSVALNSTFPLANDDVETPKSIRQQVEPSVMVDKRSRRSQSEILMSVPTAVEGNGIVRLAGIVYNAFIVYEYASVTSQLLSRCRLQIIFARPALIRQVKFLSLEV